MPQTRSASPTPSTAVRLALSLALSAGALAAPATAESPEPDTDGSPVGLISGVAAGIATEPVPGPFHPVDGAVDYGEAEAGFGNERGRPHEGQDIFAPTGTPVVSPTATEVLETGSDGGRGNWAALYDRAGDRTFVYFHLESPAEVGAGQRLAPGDAVGRVGCTGSCYGPHLHFEIRDGADPYGTPHDPLPELQRWTPVP